MRNMPRISHLKENEHIISATYKPGDPLQKGQPKSAVCCCCTIGSALCMLLPLILSPTSSPWLYQASTPGTCRSCNLLPLKFLSSIQMVVGGTELWFLCVVISRQWPLACRATRQLLVYIWLTFQTQLCTFLIINQQSDKGYIAESRQQPIQTSNTLWILCQHIYLLFAVFCLKIPMLFHLFFLFIYLLTYFSLAGFNKGVKLHLLTFLQTLNGGLLYIKQIYNIIFGIYHTYQNLQQIYN